MYLPEVLLAYMAILHRCAFQQRSHEPLLTLLNLAPILAGNGSDDCPADSDTARLKECFVASARVADLVDVLARASEGLLVLQPKKPDSREPRKRDWSGWTPFVWDVTGQHLN